MYLFFYYYSVLILKRVEVYST